jgi:hypothetical protein
LKLAHEVKHGKWSIDFTTRLRFFPLRNILWKHGIVRDILRELELVYFCILPYFTSLLYTYWAPLEEPPFCRILEKRFKLLQQKAHRLKSVSCTCSICPDMSDLHHVLFYWWVWTETKSLIEKCKLVYKSKPCEVTDISRALVCVWITVNWTDILCIFISTCKSISTFVGWQ